jgi:O-antigen/teichoic acid export membrane protein
LPWIAIQWRPKLLFDRAAFRELFGFGANVLGTRIVTYLGDSVSDSILGRVLGTASLAYYNLAFQLSMMPGTKLSWLLSRVIYPAFSLIQDEDAKMRQGYLQSVKYASVLAFPISVGIVVTAPELVRLVYGEKWLSVIGPLQVLGIGGVLNVLPALCGLVQNAKGRPDLAFRVCLFSDSSDILLTLYGVRFGLMGVALAHAVNKLVFLSVHVLLTCRLIKLSLRDYLSALSSALVCSAIMALTVTVWRLVCLRALGLTPLAILTSSVGLGVVAYLLALWAMRERALIEVLHLIWHSVRPAPVSVQTDGA